MFESKIRRVKDLESLKVPAQAFLLYDKKLQKPQVKILQKFSQKLAVSAGEPLKELQNFAPLVKKVLKSWKGLHRLSPLYVMGGGSVGDCGGFLASCLKRGVPLIHIPSTWLAAVDSSHGGKNALNVLGQKNQLGSFYPAQQVILSRDLLASNPMALQHDAFGEFIKMGLIGKSPLYRQMIQSKKNGENWLWHFLTPAIAEKNLWVRRDPFETKGLREVLNFGHSFGHILEAEKGWGHGTSVLQGIFFALAFSRQKKILSQKLYQQILADLQNRFQKSPIHQTKDYKPLLLKRCRQLFFADKKITKDQKIKFVFLQQPGKPLVKKVTVESCLLFAQKEGWVR